jgi:broad specificity phosphatase PhoE
MNNVQNISPELLNNLYLIRHGESTCNTINRLARKVDAPLSSLGIKQAKEGSKKCKCINFDKIYVSPLQRAYKTALILLKDNHITKDDYCVDKRLKERDFGELTLENKTKLQKNYGIKEYEKAVNMDSNVLEKAELYEDFTNRILDFFYNELIPTLKENKKVIVISHKYVIELLCNIILDKNLNKNFDLRLPNAEVLNANSISKYVKKEHEKLTILKEWIILHHPWVFLFSFLMGFYLSYLQINFQASSALLLGILMLSTTITLSRINIENTKDYLNLDDFLLILLRYLILPMIFTISIYLYGIELSKNHLVILLFLSIIALTISRSLGGFVVPSLLYTVFSSILSILSISMILGIYFRNDLVSIGLICLITIFLVLVVPYLIIFYLRKEKPIQTAKFADRNAYLSILLISVFITLVAMNIPVINFEKLIFVSLLAVGLRILAAVLSINNNISSLDSYISMSYPNIFLIIIITNYLNYDFISELAILFLIPMFLLSIFDSWYSKRFYLDSKDNRLLDILKIKKN